MTAELRSGDWVMVKLPDTGAAGVPEFRYGVLTDAVKQQDSRGYNTVPALFCVRVQYDRTGNPIPATVVWVPPDHVTSYAALAYWAGPVDWVEKEKEKEAAQ